MVQMNMVGVVSTVLNTVECRAVYIVLYKVK